MYNQKPKLKINSINNIKSLLQFSGYLIHFDVEGDDNIYAEFCRHCYFIFFVCEATGYVWVMFFKKKSKVFAAFEALIALLEQQYRIQVSIFHIDIEEFNCEAAVDSYSKMCIIF